MTVPKPNHFRKKTSANGPAKALTGPLVSGPVKSFWNQTLTGPLTNRAVNIFNGLFAFSGPVRLILIGNLLGNIA